MKLINLIFLIQIKYFKMISIQFNFHVFKYLQTYKISCVNVYRFLRHQSIKNQCKKDMSFFVYYLIEFV